MLQNTSKTLGFKNHGLQTPPWVGGRKPYLACDLIMKTIFITIQINLWLVTLYTFEI